MLGFVSEGWLCYSRIQTEHPPSEHISTLYLTDVNELGKSSTMFLSHGTWGFSNSASTVDQGWKFSFFIQASTEKDQSHVNHMHTCSVKNSPTYQLGLFYTLPLYSFSLFWQHPPNVCVCISVLLRDTVFLVGLVLLLSARQLCSTFTGLSVPPALHCSLGHLRRIDVHDILSVRSNEICHSFEQICDS